MTAAPHHCQARPQARAVVGYDSPPAPASSGSIALIERRSQRLALAELTDEQLARHRPHRAATSSANAEAFLEALTIRSRGLSNSNITGTIRPRWKHLHRRIAIVAAFSWRKK